MRGKQEHDGAFIAAADPPTIVAALDEIERLREALTKIAHTEVTGLGKTYTAILSECLAIARRALDGGEV